MTIKQVEDLIITELNQLPLSGYCKTIEPYAGQFHQSGKDANDAIARIAGTFPVCYVLFSGDNFKESTTNVTYWDVIIFTIITADKSLRDLQSAKGGSTERTGTYQMMEDVKTLLHKKALAIDNSNPLILKKRAEIFNAKGMSVYASDFELSFID